MERQLNVDIRIDEDETSKPVRTEMNETVPGYSFEDCARIRINGVRTKVTWKDNDDLSSLRGRRIMLAFEITGAILYGYRLSNGDEAQAAE